MFRGMAQNNATRWGESRWVRFVEWLGGDSGEAVRVFHDVLVKNYGQPHRFYHTMSHVLACLDVLDQFAPNIAERDSVELALWFHDVIYQPFAKDNEDQSAALLMVTGRRVGVAHSVMQRASDLVMLTKHVEPPDARDATAGYMIDIDLSILGEDEATFDKYESDVRKEYAEVPDNQFWPARAKILQSFLDRPSIYTTSTFRGRYEARARANLLRSIRRCSS